MRRFLGIAREPIYSPGRIDDDRAILEAVAARLRGQRYDVRIADGEDTFSDVEPDTVVFAMCQGPRAIDALRRWQRSGVRIVNAPDAIENCHRRRTLAAFAHHGVPQPESVILDLSATVELPSWIKGGAWLKRGDVHAVQEGDVVRVEDAPTARRALDALSSRGIRTALLQRHVEGNVVKFYAVADEFFAYYPYGDGDRKKFAAEEEAAMKSLAGRGASALGLEVFGGDMVRERCGVFALIDLNDWPSYARCRAGGAEAISAYLDAQTG